MQQPHKLQSILIARLTGYAIRRPLKVIAVATFAAMACVWFTVDRLELRTNRTDLVNPDSKFQQDWLEYRKTFAAADDVILVVEGTAETITPVIDELGTKLNAQPALFENIHARFDRTPLLTKGLHFLQPDQIAKIDEISQLMLNVLDSSQQTTLTPSQWDLLAKTTTDDGTYQSPWPIESIYREVSDGIPEYVINDDDSMGIVALQLVQSDQEFAQGDKPIRELRQIVADAAEKHPLIRIGVTGLPVIEYDEMSTSQHDMSIASMVTLGLVGLLFWAGFGDLRFPAFAIASLLIGIMWTCGYLTLLVGHLNILSISFGVILIGLGIDFSIHYVARYLANRRSQEDTATTIRKTAAGVGPAILAGGVTTSLAFFATALAEFRGVAELGLIAGGGILLCVVSTLLVLPAFLQLDRRNPRLTRRGTQYFWYGILRPCWSQPQHTTLWGLGITVLLAMGLVRLQYDHNLLNLQADGLDSVAWEHRLLTETDRSVWFAVSIAADRSELFKSQQQKVRTAWESYLQAKSDNFLKKDEELDAILSPKFNEFKKERNKLIGLYVEGVDDKVFEGTAIGEEVYNEDGTLDAEATTENAIKALEGDDKEQVRSTTQDVVWSSDVNVNRQVNDMYAELIDTQQATDMVEASGNAFKLMWGAVPDQFRSQINSEGQTPGRGHLNAIIEASLSDFEADLVAMDMDIKGDPFWLESERNPRYTETADLYEGENYLLFTAITSAGEPDPNTGLANPRAQEFGREQMLNGVYAVVSINSRFEGGQFVQNIKGVKDAFITDISILEQLKERKPEGGIVIKIPE